MDGDVAPPNPAVIPQVVVGVVIIDADGYFRLSFHVCLLIPLRLWHITEQDYGLRFWEAVFPCFAAFYKHSDVYNYICFT